MPWRHMEEWMHRSRIICLGTSWEWVVSFTPRPLYSLEKSLRYFLDRTLCGSQSRSGRRGGEKILTLQGLKLRSLCRPARSQSLWQLSYPVKDSNLYSDIIPWIKPWYSMPCTKRSFVTETFRWKKNESNNVLSGGKERQVAQKIIRVAEVEILLTDRRFYRRVRIFWKKKKYY
jgi:hypothetical protein